MTSDLTSHGTGPTLKPSQLRMLKIIFAKGAEDGSRTLSKWLRSGIRLVVDDVSQVPLLEATRLLGGDEEVVTACVMSLSGQLRGYLILAFGQESGLALVDMLLRREIGTTTEWGEMERSAALETANILGCAYLNSLRTHLPDLRQHSELIPSPPELLQDYGASLLESLLIQQAMVSDQVLLIRTEFTRDKTHLHWNLLLVPDLESLGEIAAALD